MATRFRYIANLLLLTSLLAKPNLSPATSMTLKYQKQIDELKLSLTCPDNCPPLNGDIQVYRVGFTPETHEDNFLPNVVFDKKHNITFFDYTINNKDEGKKCSRCGASFFKTYDKAFEILEHFTKKNKDNTGYNSVLIGTLDANDGLISHSEKSKHVTLYEFEKTNELSNKFKIYKPE